MRAFFLCLTLVLYTAPLMPLQALFLRTSVRLARWLPLHYHRSVCRILGVRVTVHGAPLVAEPHLIAANHISWLDIPVFSAVLPASFIAKSEVAGWPFFGTLARLQRCLFVDRDRRSGTGRFRNEMQQRLAEGDVLVLFPEGTSSDGNRVLPFRSALMGAASMNVALRAGGDERAIAVQPVSIAYTHLNGLPMGRRNRPLFAWYGDMEILPHIWQALKAGPVDVTVEFHQPVSVDQLGDRKKLTRHCEDVIRDGVASANAGQRALPQEQGEAPN